ncbi:retinol dehydrogenase 8-like [Lytechinus pictus]|uniref:retinol dehydrogenase 8-like n=1 Tax=Lytechinus pictus TaxID=7653 RepID=UPI0030BA2210
MSSQIVLMTGCSSGIGLATAKRLALVPNQRYIVIATVIAISEKTDLVSAVGDALNKTIFIEELDVTKDNDITSVVDKTLKEYGRIDILINVAGICFVEIPERVPRDMIEKIFNVNVFGAMRLTQAVLSQMKKRKDGKIVTITSLSGRIAMPYAEMYSSTKFALEGFFEVLAVGLRAFNIRICVVEPGPVATSLLHGLVKNFDAILDDESLNIIDRRHVQGFVDKSAIGEGQYNVMMADDVANSIVTRCIEAEKPDLRHFLPEHLGEMVQTGIADLTGEKIVENGQSLI